MSNLKKILHLARLTFCFSCRSLFTLFVSLSFLSSIGFAQSPESRFEIARPGYSFSFPEDHGAHPTYRTEWWYFTGNLQTKEKKEFGYELTFFRQGIENTKALENPSRWAVRDLYFAHFALTDVEGKQFHYQDKISREAIGKAGARLETLDVWIDRWRAALEEDHFHLQAEEGQDTPDHRKGRWKIDLILTSVKPPIIHGENGISRKGAEMGQASPYYSFTRLKTKGSIWINGAKEEMEGISWMDHEFSSSILNADQVGWDWLSIQLEDGSEYMLYQIRTLDGEKDRESSGTVIAPDGTARHLTSDDFTLIPTQYWKSAKSQADYPIGWRIKIPSEGLSLESKALLPHQELVTSKSTRITYWEGASRFQGTRHGKPVTGRGYVELTGYDAPFGR